MAKHINITRRISEFGGIANGGGIEGAIRSALAALGEGGVLIFDSTPGDYAIFSPIEIRKSVSIQGSGPNVKIINKTAGSTTFRVIPDKDFFHIDIENLTFVGGTTAIDISGSFTLAPNSRIYNVGFISQSDKAASIRVPETNIHIENIYIKGSPQYGLFFESHTSHDYVSIEKAKIVGASVAGISFIKNSIGSGSISISNTELSNNALGISATNVRYYEHNVEFTQNDQNVILSGSSQRMTGSGGGGGGLALSDHDQLTGLNDDDHKIYLHVSGARSMSANLNMGGNNITNVGTVDGADVSVLNATLDAHIIDSNNPHATSLSNLDPGTLAQLNNLITDATIPASYAVVLTSSFNEFTSSFSTQEGAHENLRTLTHNEVANSYTEYIYSGSTDTLLNVIIWADASKASKRRETVLTYYPDELLSSSTINLYNNSGSFVYSSSKFFSYTNGKISHISNIKS